MNINNYPQGMKVINLRSISSTNDFLKKNIKQFKQGLPVLVNSDEQTGGRGRNKRTWFSPKHKGIYASLAFKWRLTKDLTLLPLVAGISVIKALEYISHAQFSLKWPNDVLTDKKKIAGILIENLIADTQTICIAGFGMNINHDSRDFPVQLRYQATSLKMIHKREFNLEKIRRLVVHFFDQGLQTLFSKNKKAIISEANLYSQAWKGKTITFHQGDKIIEGLFQGINQDGSLILSNTLGSKQSYFSGEITLD